MGQPHQAGPDLGAAIGGGFWLPPWAVRALLSDPALIQWRQQLRTRDVDLYRLIVRMHEAATTHPPATYGQFTAPRAATGGPCRQLTTDQVATRLGISRRTVNRLIGDGLLRAERPGFGWLVPEAEVDRFLAGREVA